MRSPMETMSTPMLGPNEELVRRMRADLDEAVDRAARAGRQVCSETLHSGHRSLAYYLS